MEYRCMTEPFEVFESAGREEHPDRVGHPVQRETLQDPGKTQAVVTVEVGYADVADRPRGAAGQQHLALGALSRVDEDGSPVPPQEVPIVVPIPGRSLAGRSEHDQPACWHECSLWRPIAKGDDR